MQRKITDMKTENDDRWFGLIRDRLEGYEEPVGEELWQRIEKDMPEKIARRRFRSRVLRISVSAAACVAVLLSLWLWQKDSRKGVPELPAVAKREPEKPNQEVQRIEASDLLPTVAMEKPERMAVAKTIDSDGLKTMPAPDGAEEQETEPHPTADNLQPEKSEPEKSAPRTTKRTSRPHSAAKPNAIKSRLTSDPTPKKKWSMAVAVSNGFSSGGNSQGGFAPLMRSNAYGLQSSATPVHTAEQAEFQETYYNILSSNIETDTRTNVHYDLPITYSASFRYQLTGRWALNAGLSFTKLGSDWRSGSDTHFYTSKQSAYFVGVPVSASYTFFDSRYVSLYALAGGSVEKCVAGNVKTTLSSGSADSTPSETTALDHLPWQFSVMAGAGVQFNITEHYGIFAEPAVSCYFGKDELATVRTDRDANFQLTLGLRLCY